MIGLFHVILPGRTYVLCVLMILVYRAYIGMMACSWRGHSTVNVTASSHTELGGFCNMSRLKRY